MKLDGSLRLYLRIDDSHFEHYGEPAVIPIASPPSHFILSHTMDIQTAEQVVIKQANVTTADSFLSRLQQQQPPIPGQVTSVLLALKVIMENMKGAEQIDRALAAALYQLAYDSRQLYEGGKRAKVEWPPLLNADIERIAIATAHIFKDEIS